MAMPRCPVETGASSLLDPALQTKKRSLERHHLFPKAYLAAQGVEDRRLINQMANFALLEWPDNINISDEAPSTYVPKVMCRFKEETWTQMLKDHAMPPRWELMDYEAFLLVRRGLMADIIHQGFQKLKIV